MGVLTTLFRPCIKKIGMFLLRISLVWYECLACFTKFELIWWFDWKDLHYIISRGIWIKLLIALSEDNTLFISAYLAGYWIKVTFLFYLYVA